MATRVEILMKPVPRNASIVEIGPLVSPIAGRRQGWNTKIIDVAPKAELMKVYPDLPGVETIDEVDFIWHGGSLVEAVPSEYHGTFDAFIASHVIEHQPDLLSFLDCAETLLRPAGMVILAVPDKRFCFDYFRPVTLTGDVIAQRNSGRMHSSRAIFNYHAYTVLANLAMVWGQELLEGAAFSLVHTLEQAYSEFAKSEKHDSASSYVDIHAWYFTPASFELMLLELARLGLTDWHIDRIHPTVGCEFFVWLRRGGRQAAAALDQPEVNSRRLALLKRTLLEAQEQIDFVMPDRREVAGAFGELEKAQTDNRILRAELSSLEGKLAEQIALKSELAVRYYTDALNVIPGDSAIWRKCGDALKESEKYLEAEIAYERAHELDSKDAQVAETACDGAVDKPVDDMNRSTSSLIDENPRELFQRLVAQERSMPVLEIGAKQSIAGVSGDHFDWFPYLPDQNFVGSDIFPGPGVDEVADVHQLPAAWQGRFGACLSLAVFEHLARPWIAAREIFKVLRPGGLCYVATHQTFPLHGYPKDYFRFSDEALSAIFKDAGFEVMCVGYEHRTKIIAPEHFVPSWASDAWNEGFPSYVSVHLTARRPVV
jgi:2-polyprenyl-3-methyl-5-hydroxy-6-metoxy-1,4-benzoquinol methylase